MTITDRNNKLKHLITCMKCEVSGKECDDNCPTQYDAGNIGEIIENLEAISRALEQEPKLRQALEQEKGAYNALVKNIQYADAISRQAAIETLDDMDNALDEDRTIENYKELLKECYEVLPPVNPQEPSGDLISRQAVLDLIEHYNSDGLGALFYGYEEGVKFTDAVKKLPPVNQEPKAEQFAKWVAEELFDDIWEDNPNAFDGFAELACRKLEKLGLVRANGGEWELVEPQKKDNCNTCIHYKPDNPYCECCFDLDKYEKEGKE